MRRPAQSTPLVAPHHDSSARERSAAIHRDLTTGHFALGNLQISAHNIRSKQSQRDVS